MAVDSRPVANTLRPANGSAQAEVASLEAIVAMLLEAVERLERLATNRDVDPTTEHVGPMHANGTPTPCEELTERQLEILGLVAEGLSTDEIAARLWLSVATVRNHIARALRALDAHSRMQGIAKARRLGLLP
jgi:DNA-binding NarL/FixJ family response regulator